ncbi:helix-turn-helix transcriptional regulator [Nocardia sp. NPDC005746]|uniref:helix-turn-helix domain-containing protein n=1 Tax=Nocardia sp. NPDC005746 TaxID=3157062 RepID=UPI003403C45C
MAVVDKPSRSAWTAKPPSERLDPVHHFRSFIQEQLDIRGWRQADLVRSSGLSRSLVSKLLRDERPFLGQMPDQETIEGLARGFGVSEEVVRTAAARALSGYTDDGQPLQINLTEVPTDALLNEISRRLHRAESPTTGSGMWTPALAPVPKLTGNDDSMPPWDESRQLAAYNPADGDPDKDRDDDWNNIP